MKGRTMMLRRIVLALVVGVPLVVASAPAASAHGERAQEAFLRMRTVGWVNVAFDGGTVQVGESGVDEIFLKQGEEITVSGIAKLLEAWPATLSKGEPTTGFVGMIGPGPVVIVRERTVNGASAPHRIEVAKGKVYEFSMTVAGRRPGRWHIHPSFSVSGSGTLLGPGQWVNVEETAGYTNPIQLLGEGGTIDAPTGEIINLENYQLSFVWIWSTLTFIIGVAWMLYWTLLKRTVQNLAVTSQIPLNTDGMNVGLITKADHRNMNWFLLVTGALVLGGFIYQQVQWPDKLPQQVINFAPPDVTVEPTAIAIGTGSAYDSGSDTMTLSAEVTNNGTSSLQLSQFTTSTLTFATSPVLEQGTLTVDSGGEIAAGATSTVAISMTDVRWEEDSLVPSTESQLEIVGLLVFDAAGDTQFVEVHAPLALEF
jgi:methane/ammonia monooxygenase subunit B